MDAVRTPLVGIAFAFAVLLAEAFVGRAFVREADVAQAQESEQSREICVAPEVPIVDLSAWSTHASRNYTLDDL